MPSLDECRVLCRDLDGIYFDKCRNVFCFQKKNHSGSESTDCRDFMATHTVLKGVTRVLQDVFWPHFDWKLLQSKVANDDNIPYNQMGFIGCSAYVDGCLVDISSAMSVHHAQAGHANTQLMQDGIKTGQSQLNAQLADQFNHKGSSNVKRRKLQSNATEKASSDGKSLRNCLRQSNGRAMGSKIDAECCEVIRLGVSNNALDAQHSIMLRMSIQVPLKMPRLTEASGFAMGYNPLTIRIFRFLYDCGWQPICAQLAVGSGTWQLGTAVDMMWCQCRHTPSSTLRASSLMVTKLVLVELKVWQHQTYNAYAHKMLRPLQRTPCSPRNQHQLQLALTAAMTVKTLSDTPLQTIPIDSYVLRVDASSIQLVPLESWAVHAIALTAHRLVARSARHRKMNAHDNAM
jgi:hypothetical protein